MTRSLWLLLLLIKASHGFEHGSFGCPNPSYCTCDEQKILCEGNKSPSTMDIGLFHLEDKPPLFIIRGFHTVTLKNHFAHGVTPDALIISNITNLYIQTLAFVGAGSMNHLEISHINQLTASKFSLYYISDNRKIIFRNVKTQSLASNTISIKDSEDIRIEDCDFDTMSSSAFLTENVTRVILNNTLIRTTETDSIVIFGTSSTESLTLQNVSIANISTSSFKIAFTPEVNIVNCNLGTIYPKFVSGEDIDTFNFVGNVINYSESNLFQNLSTTHLVVKNNIFLNIQKTSLSLNAIQENLTFRMNIFHCTCDTWWLWNASKSFLQNNGCHLDSSPDFNSSVPLADLEPIWTNGKCSGLHNKMGQNSDGENNKKETKGKAEVAKLHSDTVSLVELRSVVLMFFIAFFMLFAM